MSYELCKCNIGIAWLVGGLGYSVKQLVRPHVLILTVGDTPSTDDQVFVCQLGSVIEVRCGARNTISYLFALFYGYRCNWYRWQRSTWPRSTNCCQRPIDQFPSIDTNLWLKRPYDGCGAGEGALLRAPVWRAQVSGVGKGMTCRVDYVVADAVLLQIGPPTGLS